MLSNRQRDILKAIIEEYINTAEPVSSAAILERYGLNCSSATIRNDMSELEGLGYLEKPHTSAGRIPSVKGYRFYVDELLNDENITLEEIDYIKQNLQTKVNEIEDLTKITTNTISEMTHYTTVAIGPDSASNIIKDIKFSYRCKYHQNILFRRHNNESKKNNAVIAFCNNDDRHGNGSSVYGKCCGN